MSSAIISKARVLWEAFWRVASATAVALFFAGVTTAGSDGLVTKLGDVDWWIALIAAAAAAGLRAVLPQPVDRANVGVAGVGPARSSLPRERPY